MIAVERKEQCCGCTACKNACPVGAITMNTDEEGFLYPFVDEDLCSHCNTCNRVCSFRNGYNLSHNFASPIFYGVKNKDENVRRASRSGGVFTAISDYVLQNGGTVYGAAFDKNFNVEHRAAVSTSQRDSFRGSKYVQSNLQDTFQEIKRKLIQGELVLFSGTPCQTAGLLGLLGKNHDNLILCDLVCHGTPSPKVWKDYRGFMERKYKGKIEAVDFRNKEAFGWREHVESIRIKNRLHFTKYYSNLFIKNQVLRPSCYECRYADMRRPSDFTLADFWGIGMEKGFDDNKGVSLLFVNTAKAQKILAYIKNGLDILPCRNREFSQPNLKNPTPRPADREEFWRDYSEKGFEFILGKYAEGAVKSSLKIFMKRIIHRIKTVLQKS